MTDPVCRGSVAVAESSGGLKWGAGCWGGKPESSHRACSPAGTRHDKYTLHKGSFLICLKHRFLTWNENFSFVIIIHAQAAVCGTVCEDMRKVLRGADLDLLLKQVDLVLLLYQLLLLLGDLKQSTCSFLHTSCLNFIHFDNKYEVHSSWKVHSLNILRNASMPYCISYIFKWLSCLS